MRKHILLALIIASLLLAACGGAAPQATPIPAAPAATETAPAAEEAVQPADEAALTTQPWQWIAFSGAEEQFTVEMPESYQVTFNADGTANIVADCNNASGTYTDQDGALTIAVGPMTMAACPDGSRSDQFVQLLSSAANYFMVDNQLYINLMDDAGVMRLGPAGEAASSAEADADAAAEAALLQAKVAAAMANPWKWTSLGPTDEAITIDDPASYRRGHLHLRRH